MCLCKIIDLLFVYFCALLFPAFTLARQRSPRWAHGFIQFPFFLHFFIQTKKLSRACSASQCFSHILCHQQSDVNKQTRFYRCDEKRKFHHYVYGTTDLNEKHLTTVNNSTMCASFVIYMNTVGSRFSLRWCADKVRSRQQFFKWRNKMIHGNNQNVCEHAHPLMILIICYYDGEDDQNS